MVRGKVAEVRHEGRKYLPGRPHPARQGEVIKKITLNAGPAEVFTLHLESGEKQKIHFNTGTIVFFR